MIEQVHHPAFPQPAAPHVTVWRFLTRHKFEWMVQEGRLFMPNAAHLGDPLEGTQPVGDGDYWQSLIDNASSEEQRRTIEHNRQLISQFAAAFRTRYYVSCWHLNNALNPDMWKRYADDSESVAVCATLSKLRAALPAYVDIGMVRYIDYAVDRLPTLNMLEYITHKNNVFESEQEVRVVAMRPIVEGLDHQHFCENHFETESDPTFRVFAPPIAASTVLDAVFVHPHAPKLFCEDMRSLCQAHGLPLPECAAW